MPSSRDAAEMKRRKLIRETQKALRLGSPPSPCALCAYYTAIPGFLHSFRVSELAVPLKQKVMQGHHGDGEKVSDFIVWLCVWCHGAESDAKYDLDPRIRDPQSDFERVLALLAGDARILKRWGEAFQSRGEWLERWIEQILATRDEQRNGQ